MGCKLSVGGSWSSMERNPEERDPEADNLEQPSDPSSGETDAPVDGPGGDEEGRGATSQDSPAP